MIISIFGKKGSGKSILSKNYMLSTGGKVIFLSPVESIAMKHTEIWSIEQIPSYMDTMRPGDILLIRLADVDAIDLVCAYAIYLDNGFTIIIDEVDKYKKSVEVLDGIHYSRHFNINLIGNTRRYVDMPRLFTSQADEMCIFQTNEPRDMQYIKEYTSKEFAEKCRNLPDYHYLHYPSNTIRKSKYINI